jgi:hypothetical protein
VAVRYFPVSQDINADPEVWELTDRFGDRALRVWLEILSIADRNGGKVKGTLDGWANVLMRAYSKGNPRWVRRDLETVQKALRWMSERGWIAFKDGSEPFLEVVNYPKYHKLRAERGLAPNHPNPSEPYSSKKKNIKTAFPERFEISDDLCKWCLAQHTEANLHYEAFKDYHSSKGSRFIDWNAAFRTWVRNAAKFSNGNGRQVEGELSERTQRILRRGL